VLLFVDIPQGHDARSALPVLACKHLAEILRTLPIKEILGFNDFMADTMDEPRTTKPSKKYPNKFLFSFLKSKYY
jgi:hypothetical protein